MRFGTENIDDGIAAIEALVSSLAGTEVERDGPKVVFTALGATFEAEVKDGANRVQVRAHVGRAEGHRRRSLTTRRTAPATRRVRRGLLAWFERQPAPQSGVKFIAPSSKMCLLFERPIKGWDWETDPLGAEVARYAEAFRRGTDVQDEGTVTFAPHADPRDVAPASAWLLLGDEASYPTDDEMAKLASDGKVGLFDQAWTAAKQAQVGDLVLVYFMSPRKAVHFVARAASDAFFAQGEVTSDRPVADKQWWTYLTPLVEIEPIPFPALQTAFGGPLILKGRSGKFLRPDTVTSLTFRAVDPDMQQELDRIVKVPVGRADLPDPQHIDIDLWRRLAAGALPLEAHVETHVVEPLLRYLLPEDCTWSRQYRNTAGVVDYVVSRAGTLDAAIEVKLASPLPPSGDWSTVTEFAQIRRYIDHLQVPGLLVDAHRVFLVRPGDPKPLRAVERRHASSEQLDAVRSHILGAEPVSAADVG
jgi:hypothetical protein